MGKRWSEHELATLRSMWREYSQRSVKESLPGRTSKAIWEKAKVLGLPFGVPQGYVSIQAAADECGFTWRGMMSVLGWAEVKTFLSYSEPGRKRSKLRHNVRQIVELDEARWATERWAATETLNAASRRTRVRFPTLRAWLADAGLLAGPQNAPSCGGGSFRLDPSAVDAVVSARRAVTTEPLTRAAARLRVGVDRLRRALIARGHQLTRGRRVRLAAGDAEAALYKEEKAA